MREAGERFTKVVRDQDLPYTSADTVTLVKLLGDRQQPDTIVITQQDIRAVQLAKAAIHAGSEVLLRRFGVASPDRVVLAGSFGTVIDRESALAIGMFPTCPPERIVAVGNAAGEGARLALLSRAKRREAEDIARRVEYVELTADPGFEEAFVRATQFPSPPGLSLIHI